MRARGPEPVHSIADSADMSRSTDSADDRTPAPRRPRWPMQVAGLVALLIVLWFAGRVVLLAFAGVLFGVLLRTTADQISRWTAWPSRLSVVVVTVVLMGLLAAVVWLFQAQVFGQFEQFVTSMLDALQRLKARLAQHDWGRSLLQEMDNGNPVMKPQELVSGLYGAASGWLGLMIDAVVIFFVGFFGALEPALYRRGLLHLVPPPRRPRYAGVLDECMAALRQWLLAKLCTMAVVGVITAAGLAVIGIQAWLLLAILAALLEFVPNFGPLLAAVPALLLALSEGGSTILWVALLYGTVQLLESNLLLPLIQEQMVRLPPVLTILAIILMGLLGGALGVLVATPLLAVVMVCIKRLYVEDTLHATLDGEPV
jgi:predicted PurR-regulated permease PerM